MKSSSFIKILRFLTREENKKFEDLVCSPYYNKNSTVIKLFKHINKFFPEFESDLLEKELVWTAVFGDKKFNYGVLKNLIYELNKLIDKFLTLSIFEEKEIEQNFFLIQSLKKKGLYAESEANLQKLRKKISVMKISPELFKYSYMLEMLEQANLNTYIKTKNKKFADLNIFNNNLISYFFSRFFSINYNSLAQSGMYDKSFEKDDLQKVLHFFEQQYFGIDVLSMRYYYLIKLALDSKNEKLYFEFKEFVFVNFEKFDRQNKYNCCVTLLRCCSDFSLMDDTKFSHETFEIIKFMFNENLYNSGTHSFIDQTLFYMAADIAAHLGETQWCKNFIYEYKDRLNPLVKENYIYLGMMLLRRSEKNFNDSLSYLSKVIPDNPLLKLTVKEFELKNYYDLGYYDEIYSLIRNNKKFLIYDKTYSNTVNESVNNLMTYLKKVLDIKLNPDDKKLNILSLERISKEINDKNVFNKNWLLEIVNTTKSKLEVKN